MKRKLFLCITPLLLGCLQSEAQQKIPSNEISPAWVKMIDNPSVNYFEAIKAYEMFWNQNTKPLQRAITDHTNGAALISSNSKQLKNDHLNDLPFQQEMIYQCKRFEQWQLEVSPFVMPDGRILTEREQDQMFQSRSFTEK